MLNGKEKVFEAVDADQPLTTDEDDERSVIKSGCSGFAHQHSYGMSIYFPWAKVLEEYENLTFNEVSEKASAATGREGWLRFLKRQDVATRRESRFNDVVTSSVPWNADLANFLAKIEMRRIEELLRT